MDVGAGMARIGEIIMEKHRHGGQVYDYATDLNMTVEHLVDFSANINPWGPPPEVWRAVLHGFRGIRCYPDSRHTQVKAVLADHLHVEPNQIICGNGAMEILELAMRTLRPKHTIVVTPAFAEYAAIARRYGSDVISVPLVGGVIRHSGLGHPKTLVDPFELPLSAMDQHIHDGDLVVLNSPHNPTGAAWPRKLWQNAVSQWSGRGAYILLDESFIDFLSQADEYTAIPLVSPDTRILVVRSATKMYALPGLRFGFGISSPELVGQMESDRDPWSVNHLVQEAVRVSYRDQQYQEKTWAWLTREQRYIAASWGTLPFADLYPPSVNFFLIRFANAIIASNVDQQLRQKGMILRNCANFEGLGAQYRRIAIRRHRDNVGLFHEVETATPVPQHH